MNTITISGHVGNDPQLKKSKSGLTWTQIRVGESHMWRDLESGQWTQGPTNWYTVKCWGQQAENVMDSIRKGTPVVVTGRLAQEPYIVTKEGDDGQQLTEYRLGLVIENATLGIDLKEGAARYFRTTQRHDGTTASDGAQAVTECEACADRHEDNCDGDIADCDGCNARHNDNCLSDTQTYEGIWNCELAAA